MSEDQLDAVGIDVWPMRSRWNARAREEARSSSSWRSRLAAIAVVVALLLRFAPLLLPDVTERMIDPNTDSVGYMGLAEGLWHGCGFVFMENGKCRRLSSSEMRAALRSVATCAELDRTPGYPVFLWLMHDFRAALVAQVLLSGAMVFVIYAFESTRWGPAAGLIAAALIALDVPSIVYSNEIMSETLFMVLFVFGVLSALGVASRQPRAKRKVFHVALSSLLFAGAILVRPVGEFAFLGPALIPLAYDGVPWAKRIGLLALMISIPAIVVAGWSLRNYRLSGTASYAPAAAKNLFYYRALGSLTFSSSNQDKFKPPQTEQTSLSGQAFGIIESHPWGFARMTAWSFLYLCVIPDINPLKHLLGIRKTFPWWRPPGSMRAFTTLSALGAAPREALGDIYRTEFDSSATLLILVALQLAVSVILWLGVMLALRRLELHTYHGICIMFCFFGALLLLVLAAGPEAIDRHRIGAIPLLAILSGVGWSTLCAANTSRTT